MHHNLRLHLEVFDHPILAPILEVLNHTHLIDAKDVADALQVNARKLSHAVELHTGYRIRNSNYAFNRHGYRIRLNGESRDAKNKVFSAK